MAEIKWIKITTEIFNDEKILLIEALPEADSIIVIWFKLLTLAGRQNNDGIFLLNNRIPYTDEMLATIFKRNINTVRLALKTFEQFGMIEIVNGAITIPNWEKHQNVDGMDKIREQTRKRVAKHREKQKLLSCNSNGYSNGYSSVTVTESNAIEEDKEEEKEKNKNNIEDKSSSIGKADNDSFMDKVREIVEYLNQQTKQNYRPTSKKTQTLIKARLAEGFTVQDFKRVIDNKTSAWLNDSKMREYLRPETLFGTKFESYLNVSAAPVRNNNNSRFCQSEQDDLSEIYC